MLKSTWPSIRYIKREREKEEENLLLPIIRRPQADSKLEKGRRLPADAKVAQQFQFEIFFYY